MIRRLLRLVTLGALASSLLCTEAGARDGHWEPPGIMPTTNSLAIVLDLYHKSRGTRDPSFDQRIETYILDAGGQRSNSQRAVRGADFKVVTTIDGGAFSSGRDAGARWRQTSNGLTRVISADIQGDDLDRWPLSDLPFDERDCTLAGEAQLERRAWVVEYHPEQDVPHWFYLDQTSGDVVREVWREGSVTVILDFDDFRNGASGRRAYHWKASGSGQREDVTLLSVRPAALGQTDVALPLSNVTLFDGAPADVKLNANFRGRDQTVVVSGSIEGRPAEYIVDSGTSQILLDGALATRAGIHTFLGHGIAHELSIGDIHLHDVAVQLAPLPARQYGAEAIVGFEIFGNRVVHIDYRHSQLSVLEKVPISTLLHSYRIDVACDSGMPLVAASVDNQYGSNFALDTGSTAAVLLRYFWEHDGANAGTLRTRNFATTPENYLEGKIVASRALGDIIIGGVKVAGTTIEVEHTNQGDTIEAPIDGIFGTSVLSKFEWWFDCAGRAVWFQIAR